MKWIKPSDITEEGYYFGNVRGDHHSTSVHAYSVVILGGEPFAKCNGGDYYAKFTGTPGYDGYVFGPIPAPPTPKTEAGET